MNSNVAMLTDHQEAFIESVKNMNDIFKKAASKAGGEVAPSGQQSQPLQKERIKGELA